MGAPFPWGTLAVIVAWSFPWALPPVSRSTVTVDRSGSGGRTMRAPLQLQPAEPATTNKTARRSDRDTRIPPPLRALFATVRADNRSRRRAPAPQAVVGVSDPHPEAVDSHCTAQL